LIEIECVKNRLWVRAVPEEKFYSRDKDSLQEYSGRIAIIRDDTFRAWSMPVTSACQLEREFQVRWKNARELQYTVERLNTPVHTLDVTPPKATSKNGWELKAHQIPVVGLSPEKRNLLLSFPTGTGKTFTSLLRAEELGCKDILIVGPKKLKTNWKAEVREILGEELFIYWGSSPESRKKLLPYPQREYPGIGVEGWRCVYATFESAKYLFDTGLRKPDMLILDEIHIVRNPETQLHKDIFEIARDVESRNGHILGMSATPIGVNIENLWGVLHLISPLLAGEKTDFLNQYREILATMPVRKNGKILYYVPIKVSTKNEDKLQAFLECVMIRGRKSDMVGFTDNPPEVLEVESSKKQLAAYAEAVDKLEKELHLSRTFNIENGLTRLLRILQICEGLFNLEEGIKTSGKLDYLFETFKEHIERGEPIVHWSRFERITRLVQEKFPKHAVVYSGAVSEGMQKLAVWAFQGLRNEDEEREFARLKKLYPDFPFAPAGALIFSGTHSRKSGLGINLPRANTSIYSSFDPDADVIFQARDRVSRLTQTQDTNTFFLTAEGTREKQILRKILQKYADSANILDGKKSEIPLRNLIAELF
jgi:SNF2 family DNA or RNA helicase